MRTQDNLEENISSFYAEILRIKLVIEGAKRGEKVFFLLDEIFKGTNSIDIHEGAKILYIPHLNDFENVGNPKYESTIRSEERRVEKESLYKSRSRW